MDKFRFYYSASVRILIAAVIIISAAGVVANVFSAIKYAAYAVTPAVAYSLLAVLTAILFAESVAIGFYGLYKFKNGCIYACFGLINSKIDVSEVVSIKVFKETDKLTLYLKNGKFTVIIISPKEYADFIAKVLKINPETAYEGA